MTPTHLAHHNAGVRIARAANWAENHCHCGAFVTFDPSNRGPRVCADCKRAVDRERKRAKSAKGAA